MGRTVLTAGRALVGPELRVVPDAAVVVEDGLIVAVGPRAELAGALDAPGVERRDHPSATVLPGLVDAHVHLVFDGSEDPAGALREAPRDELRDRTAGHAAALLRAGITTARDLGDRDHVVIELRDAIRRGEHPGPRLLAAGTPLTSPRGHCWFLGGEVDGPDAIRERIRVAADAGADLIKVMASGGALTAGSPALWESQFDRDALALIVAEAARRGLGVAAHAHGTAAIEDCVAAGVATVEHCSWRTASGLEYDERTARAMVRGGVAVCRCVSGDWRDFLRRLGANAAPLVDSIRRMRDAGVRFVAGTDAGVPGAPFGDLVGSLEFFVELGFPPAEVLAMATSGAASGLGLDDTGALVAGRRADLLVVDGDPLADLTVLRAPRLVLAGGRVA